MATEKRTSRTSKDQKEQKNQVTAEPGAVGTDARKADTAKAGTTETSRPAAASNGTAEKGKSRSAPKRATTGRTGGAAKKQNTGPDLQADLREFASAHPNGWGHGEWVGLLDRLGSRGHDTSDTGRIGNQLERARLSTVLERVEGVGPKRVQALVDRFETLWSIRHASVDEIASVPSIPRNMAERVKQAFP